MKATIDIPDELYRRVKARSALEGRRVRDVTIELYQRWLERPVGPAEGDDGSAERWLADWFRLSDELFRAAPSGPTATEVLAADRDRLERR